MSLILLMKKSLQKETNDFIRRVYKDGGQVINPNWIDRNIIKAKQLGIYPQIAFWTDANFAVKKDASGNVSKVYSLDQNENDVTQSNVSAMPQHVNSGQWKLSFDGVDDILSNTNQIVAPTDLITAIITYDTTQTGVNALLEIGPNAPNSMFMMTPEIGLHLQGGAVLWTVTGAGKNTLSMIQKSSDGSNTDAYLNNQILSVSSTASITMNYGAGVYIGGSSNSSFYSQENVYNALVFNQSISASKVSSIVNFINSFYKTF